jgi:hypothetical protein
MDTQQYVTETRPHPFMAGEQTVYRFPNGYGASVIPVMDYLTDGVVEGLHEVAILRGDEIVYDTPLTNDVIRVETESLPALLESIATL